MKKVDDKTLLAFCLTGYSQTQIAKELHMTKTAICRRINSEAFQELLAEYRNKLLDGVLTELLSHSQKAVLKLVELMDNENPFIALQAATKILQLSQDYSVQKDLLRDIEIWKQTAENEAIYNRL
ncbi:MAG: hypothetical protein J6O03_07135 [Butyrivibrio sp.]|nr:hypothetical protein [Butyrivibrio sp.]